MIVIDTSIWIEFFKNNPQYQPILKDLVENQKILAVECIFGELLQGAKSKREIEIISLYWNSLPKALNENPWIEAGRYSSQNKLFSKGVGLIDSVIIISARHYNAQIWSLDKNLNSILKKEEKYIL